VSRERRAKGHLAVPYRFGGFLPLTMVVVILVIHLFEMAEEASELRQRDLVGLADSAELLNILNFLKSLLPDNCGVSLTILLYKHFHISYIIS